MTELNRARPPRKPGALLPLLATQTVTRSVHSGGGVDGFLDQEQERYRRQLEGYADIMGKMEERPIRLGLYFPLLGGWREWSFGMAHQG